MEEIYFILYVLTLHLLLLNPILYVLIKLLIGLKYFQFKYNFILLMLKCF